MKNKKYTKEDIDKIPPFYGELPKECWRILESKEIRETLNKEVELVSDEELEEILANFEKTMKQAA